MLIGRSALIDKISMIWLAIALPNYEMDQSGRGKKEKGIPEE